MARRIRYPTAAMPCFDKPFGRGVVGSLVVHGLLVMLLVIDLSNPDGVIRGAGGEGPPGGGGGGGGSVVSYVALTPYVVSEPAARVEESPERTIELPIPAPVLKEIPKESPQVRITTPTGPVVVARTLGRGAGAGGGPGTGPGTGGGIGTGDGTGIGSNRGPGTGGAGGDGFGPRSRELLIPPPDAPPSVKGREYRVTFTVDERGRVRKVEIDPSMPDPGYRRKFIDKMRQYRFYPARTSDGTPVSGKFDIWITP